MKTSRYTEAQIIAILRQAEGYSLQRTRACHTVPVQRWQLVHEGVTRADRLKLSPVGKRSSITQQME